MPRIKFSTLVSAMAGKSNGSVFSKNRGGSYFRTNKSGYKLNTVEQQQNQAKFRSIARRWSELSDEQRNAWIAAVDNYPTKNIFGDDRVPSGYELFQRLNGCLVTRNLPVMNEPITPRVMPTLDGSEWGTPDYFLYQPKRAASTIGVDGDSFINKFTTGGFLPAYPLTVSAAGMCQFLIQNYNVWSVDLNSNISFIFRDNAYDSYRMVSVRPNDSVNALVVVEYVTVTGSASFEFLVPLTTFQSEVQLIFGGSAMPVPIAYLYINSVAIDIDSSNVSGTVSAATVEVIEFQTENSNIPFGVQVVELRAYDSLNALEDVPLVNLGYVLGTERMIVQFGIGLNAVGTGYNALNASFPIFLDVNGDLSTDSSISVQYSVIRVPKITLNLAGDEIEGFQVDIQSSRPVSSGRGLKSTDYIKVGTVNYQSELDIDITNQMAQKWTWYTEGSDFNMRLVLFDTTSGVTYAPIAIAKPPKKPRFKAGSELAGKVSS